MEILLSCRDKAGLPPGTRPHGYTAARAKPVNHSHAEQHPGRQLDTAAIFMIDLHFSGAERYEHKDTNVP